MKKIFAIAVAVILGASAASAQYLCAEQGKVLTYTQSGKDADGKEVSADQTKTVESVTTDEAGVVHVEYLDVEKVPGNDFAEIKSHSSATYNPADKLTTFVMLTAEEYKRVMVEVLVEAARSAGQPVSESDIAELDRAFRTKGELSLPLPEEPDPAAKVPNSSIKLSIQTQSMSMNLWEIKYLGFETVTVPAGTYENCLKVSYVLKTNSPEGNSKKFCTAWFAKGVGQVKEIEADKKGNVEAESVLKSIL